MSEQKLANVVFPLALEQTFTYTVPPELQDVAQVGSRVLAPFRSRTLTGFIVALPAETKIAHLRALKDVLDSDPSISPPMLKLARWIAEYYLAPLGEALRFMVPSGLMQASKLVVEVTNNWVDVESRRIARRAPRQAQILQYLEQAGRTPVEVLEKKLGVKNLMSSLRHLQKRGMVSIKQHLKSSTGPSVVKYVLALPSGLNEAVALARAPKQLACLSVVREHESGIPQAELLRATSASTQTLRGLIGKNLIRIENRTVRRDYYGDIEPESPPSLTLTDEQAVAAKRVIEAVNRHSFSTFLLFGITGSGKTQVYIEAIKHTLAQGRDAIVLVPEIALTPQTVQRFRAHFKDSVAVLHSAMSDGERLDSWHRIKQGEARVAIGPRSAVFAPLGNIGLIVVDEEHESTYKQSDVAPRYHARDVAVMRAKLAGAVVVLGSATPSSESYCNTKSGKYELLELSRRVHDVPLPLVHIIDMQKERRMSGSRTEPLFSRLLAQKIEEKVASREQVILLLNRRGFSSFIRCRECDYIAECDHCSITLTYHLTGRRLRCHYCNFSKPAPAACPSCGCTDIVFRGFGTQHVEEALRERFPLARVVRMDLDTTGRKRAHDRILTDFGAGKYDILLGTQMVAKGLDFRKVTLVGVINADIGMLLPDFRASERTFQLLTQVAGRAGRQELAGEVIIQTFTPDGFCLKCAQMHDFRRFYEGEVVQRRELNYPPFGRVICVRLRGEDEVKVIAAADAYANRLKASRINFTVLGPSPSPISRIQDMFRHQVFVKAGKKQGQNGKEVRQAVQDAVDWLENEFKPGDVKVTVDVDPVSLL